MTFNRALISTTNYDRIAYYAFHNDVVQQQKGCVNICVVNPLQTFKHIPPKLTKKAFLQLMLLL